MDVERDREAGEGRRPRGRRGLRRARVLVVDDDAAGRALCVATLRRLGYDVLQAADGSEGLSLARSELPDVILLDVDMPGLDGFQVAAALRSGRATQAIPFAFATADVRAASRDRAARLGATGYLEKPYRREALESLIARAVATEEPARPVAMGGDGSRARVANRALRAAARGDLDRLRFTCECGDRGCHQPLWLTPLAFDALGATGLPRLSPSHRIARDGGGRGTGEALPDAPTTAGPDARHVEGVIFLDDARAAASARRGRARAAEDDRNAHRVLSRAIHDRARAQPHLRDVAAPEPPVVPGPHEPENGEWP